MAASAGSLMSVVLGKVAAPVARSMTMAAPQLEPSAPTLTWQSSSPAWAISSRPAKPASNSRLGAAMVGERGGVVDADAGAVGGEIAAELWRCIVDEVIKSAGCELGPGAAAVGVERVLVGDPRQPAFARLIELPRPVLMGGEHA